METLVGAGGVGYPSRHSTGAASATTKNGMHPRSEYDKATSEVLVGHQASAVPEPEEEGHGATPHIAGYQEEEGGGDNPRRASSER